MQRCGGPAPLRGAERLADAVDPLECLSSSRARWLYADRAHSRSRLEDLSEAIWDGLALEVERAMHRLIGPMLDDHRGV